jgi:hypothetical protein
LQIIDGRQVCLLCPNFALILFIAPEHEAAIERAREIRAVLAEEGWPAPILADSGNGAHLLYPLVLPNDEASAKLVERALKALAARFNDDVVKIDQTCLTRREFARRMAR